METTLITRQAPDQDLDKWPGCLCGAGCRIFPGTGGGRIRSERDVVVDNINRFGGVLYFGGLDESGHAITKIDESMTLERYDSLPVDGTKEAKIAEAKAAESTRHPRHGEAVEYVAHYVGNFDFLQQMRLTVERTNFRGFSDKQVEAICKCIDRAAEWKRKDESKPDTGIDLFAVLPYGKTRAAVPNESGGVTFLVFDKPGEDSAKWHGWVFVKQQRGPSEDAAKVGAQRPGQSFKGQWPSLVAAVAADVPAAIIRYGKELGICGACSSPLTNDESRANGIGPVCASKM